MRKVRFASRGVYHIYNRGADKRRVFCEDRDYARFIASMDKFNCAGRCLHLSRQQVSGRGFASTISAKLVKVLYFVLMPNHFHIVLQQLAEVGVEKFMQKIGTGYTMYFNEKHKRSGVLFQGVFKAVPIETDSYIAQISQYIHLNPLKFVEPEFREKGIRDVEKAKTFLRNYRWSSYLDYIGIKNYPSLIDNELHRGYFENNSEYEKFVLSGIKDYSGRGEASTNMVEAKPRPE